MSRLRKIEEQRIIVRSIAIVGFALVILTILGIFGPPLFTNFSLLLGPTVSINDQITDSKNNKVIIAPRLNTLPYEATSSAEINISGTAVAGGTVELLVNGEMIKKTVVANDGSFSFTDTSLIEGENKIEAIATVGDTKSLKSQPLILVHKKSNPKVEIANLPEGASFSGENNEIRIEGRTDSATSLTVNGRIVIIKNDGTFVYPFKLNDGENKITIIAIDKAGNQTTVERTVIYTP